jgi:hypothetical protein
VFFPHLILTSPPTISSAASLFFLLLFSVTGPISRDASRVLASQRASHLPIAPGTGCDAYSARSLQPRGASDVTEPATPPLSYGPPWAHYLGGYQDRLLGGPLGLPGLRYTAPEGVELKDYTGVVLG